MQNTFSHFDGGIGRFFVIGLFANSNGKFITADTADQVVFFGTVTQSLSHLF